MNPILLFIIVFLITDFALNSIADHLNLKNFSTSIPKGFSKYYQPKTYQKSQKYLKTNTKFTLIQNTISLPLTIIFILLAGFNHIDLFARSFGYNQIFTGLIFATILYLISYFLSLPFSIYQTFVIENYFGFNRTTPATFFIDQLKNLTLTFLIGAPLFTLLIYLFSFQIQFIWFYTWLIFTLIQLVLIFIFPTYIMPLFNKFTPLPKGKLKTAIQKFAKSEDFTLAGIYTMDGSRRSSKSNAFFTGFGSQKRIVLFDTLIDQHTVPELVSILAHEIGHYKKKHIHKMFLLSSTTSLVMFYLIFSLLQNQLIFQAFLMQHVSIYASIIFILFLIGPLENLISLFSLWLSRRHEFQADEYAVNSYQHKLAFISALKKLSANNLSNLSPHPLKVFLSYSHPPVTQRIKAIKSL